jgi:hypothetical protein
MEKLIESKRIGRKDSKEGLKQKLVNIIVLKKKTTTTVKRKKATQITF